MHDDVARTVQLVYYWLQSIYVATVLFGHPWAMAFLVTSVLVFIPSAVVDRFSRTPALVYYVLGSAATGMMLFRLMAGSSV